MPLHPTDTSSDKSKKSGPDIFSEKNKKKSRTGESDLRPGEDVDTNVAGEPNQANYGFGNRARFDSENEETQEQEYKANGLQRTAGYSGDDAVEGTRK